MYGDQFLQFLRDLHAREPGLFTQHIMPTVAVPRRTTPTRFECPDTITHMTVDKRKASNDAFDKIVDRMDGRLMEHDKLKVTLEYFEYLEKFLLKFWPSTPFKEWGDLAEYTDTLVNERDRVTTTITTAEHIRRGLIPTAVVLKEQVDMAKQTALETHDVRSMSRNFNALLRLVLCGRMPTVTSTRDGMLDRFTYTLSHSNREVVIETGGLVRQSFKVKTPHAGFVMSTVTPMVTKGMSIVMRNLANDDEITFDAGNVYPEDGEVNRFNARYDIHSRGRNLAPLFPWMRKYPAGSFDELNRNVFPVDATPPVRSKPTPEENAHFDQYRSMVRTMDKIKTERLDENELKQTGARKRARRSSRNSPEDSYYTTLLSALPTAYAGTMLARVPVFVFGLQGRNSPVSELPDWWNTSARMEEQCGALAEIMKVLIDILLHQELRNYNEETDEWASVRTRASFVDRAIMHPGRCDTARAE